MAHHDSVPQESSHSSTPRSAELLHNKESHPFRSHAHRHGVQPPEQLARFVDDTLYPEEVQGFRKLPGTGEKRRSASLADWAERLGRMIKMQGEGTIPS
jgi:hypothetical protein